MDCKKCAINVLDITRNVPVTLDVLDFYTKYPPATDRAKDVAWEQVSLFAGLISSRLEEAIETCELQRTAVQAIKMRLNEARREGNIPKVKATIEDLVDVLANGLRGF